MGELEEIRREIERLSEQLQELREKERGAEEEEERRHLIERIWEWSGGDMGKIQELLDDDTPVCLICGPDDVVEVYYGATVLERGGRLELVEFDSVELKCTNDSDHTVLLPSVYGIDLEDFERFSIL